MHKIIYFNPGSGVNVFGPASAHPQSEISGGSGRPYISSTVRGLISTTGTNDTFTIADGYCFSSGAYAPAICHLTIRRIG
jgi:hypothetical protein